MPSFPDSIFLFVLALLLFGPKRLPVLARELGKWVGEFRRASNEFKMQMEDELRLSEQAERNKQIAAMEAAAPVAPAITETAVVGTGLAGEGSVEAQVPEAGPGAPGFGVDAVKDLETGSVETQVPDAGPGATGFEVVDGVKTPLPIAVSGDLKIMPPATGLPAARNGALHGLLEAIPAADPAGDTAETTETTVHGN
jgi:sec-independent protein translocase protein TatB